MGKGEGLSATDDAEYSRLAARAERAFPGGTADLGIDEARDLAPPTVRPAGERAPRASRLRRAWRSPAVRSRRGLAIAVGVLAVFAVVAAGGFAVLHRSGLPARDYPVASLAGTIFGASQVPLARESPRR